MVMSILNVNTKFKFLQSEVMYLYERISGRV